jgi:hypothetical protein
MVKSITLLCSLCRDAPQHIKNEDTNGIEPVAQLHDWEYSRSLISAAPRGMRETRFISIIIVHTFVSE